MVPILIIGGAPRMAVDAVRYLSVHATGNTACRLAARIRSQCPAASVHLLLPEHHGVVGSAHERGRMRYADRGDLDAVVAAWVATHSTGIVVCSAAINDYQVAGVESIDRPGSLQRWPVGSKVPSGAVEVRIVLHPAPKLVDQLTHWGHRGPLVVFKYEHADTVVAAAHRLRTRVGARLAVANSLCATVQCLIDDAGVQRYRDRAQLEAALADTLCGWISAPST
jgi:phosphopantothenoylcysteine synthetase/decarboxylase